MPWFRGWSWVRFVYALGLTELTPEEIEAYEQRRAHAFPVRPHLTSGGEPIATLHHGERVQNASGTVVLTGPQVGQAVVVSVDLAAMAFGFKDSSPDGQFGLSGLRLRIRILVPALIASSDHEKKREAESLQRILEKWG